MNRHLAKGLLSTLAIVIALFWAFPVYWMVSSSFIPTAILQSFIPTFFPVNGTVSNYAGAIADGSFSAPSA